MSSTIEVNVLVRAPPSPGGNIVDVDEIIQDAHARERKLLPPDKIYHVFFSYADEHKLWVKEVVRKLEMEHGYICCDHERDFLAGSEIMKNIRDGITKSAKVVVVLSEEALKSGYMRQEIKFAHKFGIDNNKNLLIPVLLEDCDIPDELMLLTYIDAREWIGEKTWWPKLLAAVEANEQGWTPLLTQLGWIGNRVACKNSSIQPSSKDSDRIPVSIADSTRQEILYDPRIRCRQKYRNLVYRLLIAGAFIFIAVMFPVINETPWKQCGDCTILLTEVVVVILIAIGCVLGRHYFSKVPSSVEKKIVERNKILIQSGVMVTLWSSPLWAEAKLVFYQCNIEQCKAFVIWQLKKHARSRRVQRLDTLAQAQRANKSNTVQLPIKSRSENQNEDTMELELFSIDEGENEHEPLLGLEAVSQSTENNMQQVSIDAGEDEHETPAWSEAMDVTLEDTTFRMLMNCTPEYLRKAFASELINNNEEDRHSRNYTCLCQYLEKVDNQFHIIVERNKIIGR